LHLPKPLRHSFIIITGVVDDDRQQESLVGSHQVAAIDRKLPLETEIPLVAIVRVPRDDREEQGAGLNLPADRLVPGVPATQLALVEPNLDSDGSQARADPLGRCGVSRGVTQEYRPDRHRN
jgi:hypothetical protein